MTEPDRTKPVISARRRRSLYRTMLSLAIAAIVAAWLPFSVFYMNALNKRAVPISLVGRQHSGSGTVRVITTASGATRVVAGNGPTPLANGPALASVAPTSVTTRAS